MTLADRVVILSGGNIEQVGHPIDLYKSPENLFVAGFIGTPSMNLIDATIAKTDAGMTAVFSCGQSVPLDGSHNLEERRKVVVGMRPEHFAQNSSGAPLSGTVTLVEPTGAQTHVSFEMAATLATAVLEGGIDVDVGQMLSVSIDPEKVHVFDKETGRRV